ncbi:MAG: cysteine desulfurase, partial [Chloroflexaceae bacterium]|nr:cysteine desulfurase [Chloroflexaceae bacterium]
MSERTIYLDHAATTPLDPRVLEAMLPYLTEHYGNPSSIHRLGRAALQALDDAREQVALVLGCSRREVIFTGGGSESINLAIKGAALARRAAGARAHLIVSAIEHHAVLHAAEYLHQQHGFEVTLLPVDARGLVRPDDLRAALRPDTALVSVMYANNEIGAIQPIADLGAICREAGVPLHTDAVQAAGALPLDVEALKVDYLSLTAHKFYGPKGVGALYARRGAPLLPQINGGAQERRRRAGTENVAGIVGLAAALTLAEERRPVAAERLRALRERLVDGVLAAVPNSWLNGDRVQRLPGNANLGFAGIEGESLLLLLDQAGICASSGSACTSGSLEPSHVLLALGLSPAAANGSVRFSLGHGITEADITYVLETLPPLV